ncbi:MAG: NAD(P)/FAD-dependent oxidoreductase [Emcibacter sp.]|nr:NAD(P)/FAD-dependent oxidoreductase [Emcibacter sp.]
MVNNNRSIVIMGGGPAGVFTACGLVDLGYSATIITRPRPFPAWEGISERPRTSLQHFGFRAALASIGPMVTRAAHWNGQSQAQNREYILNRQTFDQALLQDAKNKGVQIIHGRVEKAVRHENGWEISYVTSDAPPHQKIKIKADFLVDARGRESKLAKGGDIAEGDSTSGPATSALLKSYEVSPDLDAMTSVASFPKGWAWFLRDGEGTAILQIFINSEKGELPPKAGLDQYFSELTSILPESEAWLRGTTEQTSGVSVRTAAANRATCAGGNDFLVVGDGALALDPLSGNGIFYAIGSGLSAAPVINSLLKKPEDKDLALQFYQERIENSFKAGCLMGREFYAAEERWPEEAFWKARRLWPRGEGASHPDPLLQPAKICKKPVVKEGFIALEDVIVTADHPRGVWKIDGIPLVKLMVLLAAKKTDNESAAVFGAEAAQVTSARNWLLSRNMLEI